MAGTDQGECKDLQEPNGRVKLLPWCTWSRCISEKGGLSEEPSEGFSVEGTKTNIKSASCGRGQLKRSIEPLNNTQVGKIRWARDCGQIRYEEATENSRWQIWWI